MLFLAVTALLLFVIFPWIEPHLPISQVTVRDNDDARPGRRQLRQLRLQPRPVPGPARRRGRRAAQRRRRRRPSSTGSRSTACCSRPGRARRRTPARRWRSCRRARERELPLFGVCLGHQAIGAAFGAPIVRAPELLHGKTSAVEHDGTGVLAGLPSPFTATRYHSLAVEEAALPAEILVTGRTRVGRGDGAAARDAADRRRAVPPRVGADRRAGTGWSPTGCAGAARRSPTSWSMRWPREVDAMRVGAFAGVS